MTRDDFEILARVGQGTFATVYKVRHKRTGKIYAMKELKLTDIRERGQLDHFLKERYYLASLSHPFIAHLYYAFISSTCLYLVTDFAFGGDLLMLIKRYPLLNSALFESIFLFSPLLFTIFSNKYIFHSHFCSIFFHFYIPIFVF